jgi:hypothetical protein
VDDVAAWYSARRAVAPKDLVAPQCREVHVGTALEPALLCKVMSQRSAVHGVKVVPVIVDHMVVRAVRGPRVVTMFDVPYLADPLDKEHPEQGPLLETIVDVAGAGSEIVVREPGPGACAAARATIAALRARAETLADKQERSFGIAEADLDESVRTSICARVGRYVWMNGAFAIVKDRPTGPLSAPPK